MRRSTPRPALRWLLASAFAVLVATLVLAVTARAQGGVVVAAKDEGTPPAAPPAKARLLELVMMDVGQGDGLVLRSPDGKVVVLDAGPREAEATVLGILKALGITTIDLAIGSHPHEDHIGSMASVVEALQVKRYIDPGYVHTSITYQNLLRTLEQRQVPYAQVRRNQKIDLKGGVMLTVLAPEDPLLTGTRSDANSNSVVSRLTYGGFSALLTGDAEHDTELRLLGHPEERELLHATVLKVAHHGGRYSTYADFLDAVAPNIALISVGAGNSYGHPAKATLSKLERRGIKVLRTDERGTVRLRTDGEWIWIDALGAPVPGPTPADAPTMTSTPLGVFPAKATMVAQALGPGDEDDAGGAPPEPDQHEASAPASPTAVDASQAYIASNTSKVFHKATCGNAKRISTQNQRIYTTRDAALADGKTPAQCCHP